MAGWPGHPHFLLALTLALSGCGGPELLRKPEPLVVMAPVAQAADDLLEARLDAVVVRNGPGAWALDAYWDEYRLVVASRGTAPIEIREVSILDAFGHREMPRSNRHDLRRGTVEGEWRRRDRPVASLLVDDPRYRSPESIVGGAAVGIGAGVAAVSATPVIAATPGAVAALGPVAGLVFLPFVIVGAITYVNESGVDAELARRQTPLPALVEPGEPRRLDLFFPVTVLPAEVRVSWAAGSATGSVILDVRAPLAAAHLEPPPTLVHRVEPDFPREAIMAGIESGLVVAQLDLYNNGSVKAVHIVESQPPGLFEREAARALYRWRYSPMRTLERHGSGERTAQVRLEFRR